ncbi:MAG: hypothetical protein CL780_04535 [Chloroflexi bacterium]|nr:hypothetical protein [Chloroflexota bacterium]|tara:strand:- start:2061 stop:2471 length:411 start_codon:yes stop_codon:yes gene_type:complete
MSTLNSIPSNFTWNSKTIKSLRVYTDMSQTDLAQKVGVRQQTISEWETETYRPRGASIKMLNMIASDFGYDFRTNLEKKILIPGKTQIRSFGNEKNHQPNGDGKETKALGLNDHLWWKTIKQPNKQRIVSFKEFPM